MNRGKSNAFAIPHDVVTFFVAALGNTTNPPTVPVNGTLTAAGAGVFPIAANGIDKTTAGAPTRTSAGLYVIGYEHQLPHVFPIGAYVVSDGAAPTASLEATIQKIVPSTRKVTVLVTVPSTGAATDLGTSDLLVMTLGGIDSATP